MQNRVFKAEVKAKVIALPAQEWIKSEIPTLASFALKDSSWRMNLLVMLGWFLWFLGGLFCCVFFLNLSPYALPIWVCRAHSICHGPDWVFTGIEQH